MAVITLDLGITYSEQGRASQVVELIQEAMPVFKTFRSYPEGAAALRILHSALAAEVVALESLQAARAHLERLRRDPSVQT